MIVCPTCGSELDSAIRFCPKDGTTIRAEPARAVAGVTDEALRETRPLTPQKPARPPEADALVGAIIDGRYRVKARLGSGGVGAVYEGEHVETRRAVAVKVLHAIFSGTDEFHRRFEREARAASRLTHPSCVSVIDFGRVERVEPVAAGEKLLGIPYLVMEFVRGKSLAQRLDDAPGRRVPPTEAVLIARGVLSALKHAHGLGIVHRDIKPANVMLVEDGGTGLVVKLLDFGLAKMVGERETSNEPLTQAGMVFGTPAYLSPEQASGKSADARSDLYALGIVLYEMVAGRRPFVRPDPIDVVRDQLQTLPPPPRTFGAPISAELEAAILKSLAKDPSGRWASAEEMSAALAKVPEVGAPSATPAPATTATAKLPLTRPQLLIGAGALALVTLVTILLATRHPAPAPAPPLPAPVVVVAPAPPSAGAQRHLATAVKYANELWCHDALNELERALADDPRLRTDASLHGAAIKCLRPKTRDRAIQFLVERVGAPARGALEAAAANGENAEQRREAGEALARLPR